MHPFLRTRLCVHMFFSGALIGAWQPVLVKYLEDLGYTDFQIAMAYATGAMAMLVSPLVVGQIADRRMAAERVLALTNLGAGVLLLAARFRTDFASVFVLLLGSALLSMPTFPLGTALSFHHLPDGARQFPAVRVWGTIGWVAGALFLSGWLHFKLGSLPDCLAISGVLALANGAYALTLPHTPPGKDATGRSAVGKAVRMLRDPGFALFAGLLFALSIFGVFFFQRAPIYLTSLGVRKENLSALMSVGQIAEVLMVFALPVLYVRIGAKGTIAVGIAAWALRYFCFRIGEPFAFVVFALALHGICFACGRIGATIYVDRICDRDARASAQSLLSLMIDGAGPLLGSYVAGAVSTYYRTAGGGWNWKAIWLIPAVGCTVVLFGFLFGFRSREKPAPVTAPSFAKEDKPAPGEA